MRANIFVCKMMLFPSTALLCSMYFLAATQSTDILTIPNQALGPECFLHHFDNYAVPPSDQLELYQMPHPLGQSLPNFQYVINRDICGRGHDEVYMMLLVGSHPSHRNLRDVIRKTVGNPKIAGFPFRLAFFFGLMPSETEYLSLVEESDMHGDIIQGNFLDSYGTLMLRDLMSIRWAWQYCCQAQYIMHLDDDTSIDIYKIIDVLHEQFSNSNYFIGCFYTLTNTGVMRDGKYAVSKEEYPGDTYDPYCQGWMYIMTPAMAYYLDVAALHVPNFWMNDAFLTGSLVKWLGTEPRNLHIQGMDVVILNNADAHEAQSLHNRFRDNAELHQLPKTVWRQAAVDSASFLTAVDFLIPPPTMYPFLDTTSRQNEISELISILQDSDLAPSSDPPALSTVIPSVSKKTVQDDDDGDDDEVGDDDVLEVAIADQDDEARPIFNASSNNFISTMFQQKLACTYHSHDASYMFNSGQFTLYPQPSPLSRNLDNFRYLQNWDICEDNDIYMMVLVGSHPEHRKLRDAIRSTWGHPNITGLPIGLAFFYGKVFSGELQLSLEAESREHRDMIQGNFEDSHKNVLLRDLMGLRWAWQFCCQAKFVMHADDSISVDVYNLVDVLQGRFKRFYNFVACFKTIVDVPVLRSGPHAVSELDYPHIKYDPYCLDWMYILTPSMAFKLDVVALNSSSLSRSDVFITGKLVDELGKVPMDLMINYTTDLSEMQDLEQCNPELHPKYTVGPTGGDAHLIIALHRCYNHYAVKNGLPNSK